MIEWLQIHSTFKNKSNDINDDVINSLDFGVEPALPFCTMSLFSVFSVALTTKQLVLSVCMYVITTQNQIIIIKHHQASSIDIKHYQLSSIVSLM